MDIYTFAGLHLPHMHLLFTCNIGVNVNRCGGKCKQVYDLKIKGKIGMTVLHNKIKQVNI